MNTFKIFLALSFVLTVTGCTLISDTMPPPPSEILKKAAGTESVKLGMKREAVRKLWGDPDQVNEVRDKERWGGERTEWVYFGRSSGFPFDAGYLFNTQRLYFDGDSLTTIQGE